MGRTATFTLDRMLALAARPVGVSSAELQRAYGCDSTQAFWLQKRGERNHGLQSARVAGKLRHFSSAQARDHFLASPRLCATVMHAAQQAKANATAARLRAAPPAAAAAVGAPATPMAAPLVPAGVHRTVVPSPVPEPRRINLMADPLPGVPGWKTGPVIRAGALDYRQHQRHGGF